VLELPAYRRLLCAYAINELAWLAGSLALAVLVYDRTGSALGATAFFLCSQFLPALLSPLIVARLDQRPPRSTLAVLFGVQAAAALVLGLVAHSLPLVPLLAIVAGSGLATLTSRSLVRASTVAVIAPAGLLREGNALANTAFSISFALGPALGGIIVAADSVRLALLINAVLLACVAALLGSGALATPQTERAPTRGRLRAAFDYAKSRRGIRILMAVQAIAILFFTISVPVEVVFAEHTLHSGAGGYGALLATWGAGAIAGAAVYARWRARENRVLIAIGAGALGVGFLVMSLAPSLAVAIVGAIIGGAGNGVEAVSARTALQELVEQRWMAMMMSFNDSMFQFMPGIGIVLGGALAALAGARVALAVAGAGALAVTLAVWILLRPDDPAEVKPRAEGPGDPWPPSTPRTPQRASGG
jgi:MFS family permease